MDHARARAAFARFEGACRAIGLQERRGVNLEFIGVDVYDQVALGSALDRGLRGGAVAIVAPNASVVVEAIRKTHTIPIIFGTHRDPVELRLAASLVERPSNLAGISFHLGVEAKMLELLRETVPGARRIGYIVDRDQATDPGIAEFFEATRSHGLDWKLVLVSAIDTLERDVRAAGAVDAWFVTKAGVVEEHRDRFISVLNATRVPAIYPSQREVEAGGAISYEAVFEDPLGAIARQLDRVLSGVRPSDIPIERPKRFTLSVNIKSARALGMKLSPNLLARADHVL